MNNLRTGGRSSPTLNKVIDAITLGDCRGGREKGKG